ncbi:AI-2E family transporter [Sphingorhabdus sp.]|jgi:predicted PurR-regulated permease PerM|uniref:AI-2E family transporter n=1 Tax=Sphingorhabdus sp. TaxID=1902408 RepID=UPI003BB05593
MSDPAKPKTRPKRAMSHEGAKFEDRVLLGFVAAASLAMVWISWPFFGAILWALVVTIAFAPVHDRLALMMPRRRNSVALLSLLLVIALVIVPAFIVGSMMVDEALKTYNSLQSREIDLGKIVRDIEAAIPSQWRVLFERYVTTDVEVLQARLSSMLTSGLQLVASEAVSVGQGAFSFAMALGVMLYLTFFLLRDGRHLTRKIGEMVPLRPEQRGALFDKFTTVIRATVKGSVIVAIVQGILGGFLFSMLDIRAALLWGVVMGLLALIPAVGTGLVWFPVGIYLLVTGSVWHGVVLLLCGFFIISMVDNVLRPILVGQDTRMPDYVVLISTLGGLSVMGINGLIVGPVVAAMFISAWEIFGESRAAERH